MRPHRDLTYDQAEVLAHVWSAPWCTTRQIADETGQNVKRVLRHLQRLEELDLVVRREGPRVHQWTCVLEAASVASSISACGAPALREPVMSYSDHPSGPVVAALVDAVERLQRDTGRVSARQAAEYASHTLGRTIPLSTAREALRWCAHHGLATVARGKGGGFLVVYGGAE